jgi:hypothetical protein
MYCEMQLLFVWNFQINTKHNIITHTCNIRSLIRKHWDRINVWQTVYKGNHNECVWHSTVSVHLTSLRQSFVVICLSKCCCHCWINCLKVQNNTWAYFVNGEPKIKNYTDANRILWHDKNAAWVCGWVCCFKNEQKSNEKGPAVQCGVKMMENSICEMEIYGSHHTILNEDLKCGTGLFQNYQQTHWKHSTVCGFPLSCICTNQWDFCNICWNMGHD